MISETNSVNVDFTLRGPSLALTRQHAQKQESFIFVKTKNQKRDITCRAIAIET